MSTSCPNKANNMATAASSWRLLAVVWACGWCAVMAGSATSPIKSQHSNPVLHVAVQGQRLKLILTTDVDGILFCQDRTETLAASATRIDYDYARKLLRYQLSGMIQQSGTVHIKLSWQETEPQASVGVFYISQQSLSPAALAYFLHQAEADGFIGVGYAFRVANSPFWKLFGSVKQYKLTFNDAASDEAGDDGTSVGAVSISAVNATFDAHSDGQSDWDWSEHCASVDQADDLTRTNNQGLAFPVHHVQFQCARPSEATDESGVHTIDMMGDFTSNWDASIDFNAPCLVLPQQYYNSLAGWIGLTYDEDLKLTEIAADTQLPSLQFALRHDGPRHTLDLNQLQLNLSSVPNLNSTGTKKWLCLQRSTSIVHNGASVFSPIDTDTASQRMRLHGTMMLPVFNMLQAPIVLGSMALRAMGELLVDGDTKQVAFIHPSRAPKVSTSFLPTCVKSPECIGQQQFSVRLNACMDPDCSSYYFQHMDAETKLCVINQDWLTFLCTAVAVLVSAELLLSTSISRLVRTAITVTTES